LLEILITRAGQVVHTKDIAEHVKTLITQPRHGHYALNAKGFVDRRFFSALRPRREGRSRPLNGRIAPNVALGSLR
jgi:hypothetical protein